MNQKWTVEVTVGGQTFSAIAASRVAEANSDTLATVRRVGLEVAREAIAEEYGSDAAVVVYKQLAGQPSPVRDRCWYLFRDWDRAGNARIAVQAGA